MRILARILTLLFSLSGLATFSQAPEFAQQYRQRLGGAVEELRRVVADFDADAGRSSMSREQALSEMNAAETPFVRDRGASMSSTITRYETLENQLGEIDTAPQLVRPLLVLKSPDRQIVEDAWKVFEPAVPLTTAGGIWGGAGLMLGFVSMWGGTWLARKGRARMRGGNGGKIRIGAAAANEVPSDIVIEEMPAKISSNISGEVSGGVDSDAEKTGPSTRTGIAMMAVKPGPEG
ncbi:MAG: DUF2937 family protein [Nitratireductor sp.]